MIDRYTDNLIVEIVARDVAVGVELARSLGHKMPAEFDVGVLVVERSMRPETVRTRVRIRLGDTSYDSLLMVPRVDGSVPLLRVKTLWREAVDHLRADALMMASVWIKKHPEANVPESDLKQALQKLALLKDDETIYETWLKDATQRAQQLVFKRAR